MREKQNDLSRGPRTIGGLAVRCRMQRVPTGARPRAAGSTAGFENADLRELGRRTRGSAASLVTRLRQAA